MTDREVVPGCARVRTKCVEVVPGCARVRTKCVEKTSVGLWGLTIS